MAMSDELVIRNMDRAEIDELVEWAAAEGWNPGLHDADLFWATDPAAFIAADLDGALIGGGAITSYQGEFGFMGFFIVRPEYRSRGMGNTIWCARRDRLLARLHRGASIGMDGVFAMQDYYSRGGFVFSHRNLRFRADVPHPVKAPTTEDRHITLLQNVPFSRVLEYDRGCFPAPRPVFLKAWIEQPDALALAGCKALALCGAAGRGANLAPCSLTMQPQPRRSICSWLRLPPADLSSLMPRKTTPLQWRW